MNNPKSRSEAGLDNRTGHALVPSLQGLAFTVSLRTKLVVGFLAVALIPMILLAYLNNTAGGNALAENVGISMKTLARTQALLLGDRLDEQIQRLQQLSQNQALVSAVQAANAAYTGDAASIQADIDRLNAQWQAADARYDNDDPLVRSRLSNESADILRSYRTILPDNVEILLTDKHGALVATSNRPSDYNQANKEWWQKTWKNGNGAIYLGQLDFDESTLTYASDIAVPILDADGNAPIGVLRTTLRLGTLMSTLQLSQWGQTGRAELFLTDRLKLGAGGEKPAPADESILAPLKAAGAANYIRANYESVPSLISQAEVTTSNPERAAPFAQLPWRVIVHQDLEESLAGSRALTRTAMLLGLLSIIVVTGIAVFSAQLLAAPIMRLTAVAGQVAAGDLTAKARQETRDEIGALAAAFNIMIARLRQTLEDLEQRVAERTVELSAASEKLNRRLGQLQTSSEVSRAVTMLTDPDQLISQVVELIESRFGFHYVGLFLVDAENRFAVLQQGSGEAGRIMKERGHRLEIGGQSMVGSACAEKQACIAQDVGAEAVRFANPLLPDTHSEMALPLRVGDRILGALDVQSTEVAAFDEDDIAVLQGMADQIAIALENASLFQQTQSTLGKLEATNRLLAREGWQSYFEQASATRRGEFYAETPGSAEPPSQPLSIPLELRGQPLGRLALERHDGGTWSQDEIDMVQAIALQTVLAADNARLLEQTQHTLAETRALYESSREITSAGEMDELLGAVLNNLARTDVHGAAAALFDTPTREGATLLELAAVWDQSGTPRLPIGAKFAIADFPLINRISGEAPLVSADILSDSLVDDAAKQLLSGLGFRAMAITPLRARGQWIGALFAMADQPRAFTPSELGFHRALADQAAVAIDSHRLLAETQRRAQREALIRQITTRIRSAGDIEGVMETTAAELARSLGVSRAVVRLTMGNGGRAE